MCLSATIFPWSPQSLYSSKNLTWKSPSLLLYNDISIPYCQKHNELNSLDHYTSPAQHTLDDVLLSKDGRSKVESSWFLTEARTGNDADSCGFKQGKSIKGISSHAGLLGGCYCLLWQMNLGEGIHSTLHSVAGDPLDGVEGVCHQLCSLGQRGQDPIHLNI